MEENVEGTERKPNIKAQIPFLADLIKLEKQLKKSEDCLNNEGCSSWACKEEIIDKEQTDLENDLKQPVLDVDYNKIYVKEELCAGIWNDLVDFHENGQEIKSQCDVPHPQHGGQDTLSETLSEQAGNIEKINNENVSSEIIDGNMEDTAKNPKTRSGVKAFKCDVCGKAYNSNQYLNIHKITHTGETPYKCDVCGKAYTTKGTLVIHKITHTGEKPYKCDMCGKKFARTDKLYIHKRTHTGEKPYKCDVCGKKFARTETLNGHKGTHAVEKPYKCDVCGKGYTRKDVLIIHKVTHTGEKPYKCDMCGKGSNTKNNMIIHKRTHTGEKPYKCDVCGKKFARTDSLNSHKRTHT